MHPLKYDAAVSAAAYAAYPYFGQPYTYDMLQPSSLTTQQQQQNMMMTFATSATGKLY